MSITKVKHDPALLMTTLKFSADDLRVNHTGVMTFEQKGKLRRLRLEASVIPLGFALFAGALTQVTIQGYDGTSGYLLRLLGACTLLFAAILFGVLRWLKITADLRNGVVSVVTGSITLDAGETRNIGYVGSGSRMAIEGIDFIIPFAARQAFLDGKMFHVYYAPNTKIILSAERHIH